MPNLITQHLDKLTQFLSAENKELESKQKEMKVQLALDEAVTKFKSISPEASPEDIRQVMLETLKTSNTLGVADKVGNVISALYDDKLKQETTEKTRKQEELLATGLKDLLGNVSESIPAGLTGTAALQYANAVLSQQKSMQTYDAEGRTYFTIFNTEGEQVYDYVVDPRTAKEKERVNHLYDRSASSNFMPVNTTSGETVLIDTRTGNIKRVDLGGQLGNRIDLNNTLDDKLMSLTKEGTTIKNETVTLRTELNDISSELFGLLKTAVPDNKTPYQQYLQKATIIQQKIDQLKEKPEENKDKIQRAQALLKELQERKRRLDVLSNRQSQIQNETEGVSFWRGTGITTQEQLNQAYNKARDLMVKKVVKTSDGQEIPIDYNFTMQDYQSILESAKNNPSDLILKGYIAVVEGYKAATGKSTLTHTDFNNIKNFNFDNLPDTKKVEVYKTINTYLK